jgi:chromosome segregation ATPase
MDFEYDDGEMLSKVRYQLLKRKVKKIEAEMVKLRELYGEEVNKRMTCEDNVEKLRRELKDLKGMLNIAEITDEKLAKVLYDKSKYCIILHE